jgi:formylglycine-generating enzyme required for sulfatase activity
LKEALGLLFIYLLAGCKSPTDPASDRKTIESNIIVNASNHFVDDSSVVGTLGVIQIVEVVPESRVSLSMTFVKDTQDSINFPAGLDDTGISSIPRPFWMGGTEVTNGALALVYKWALANNKLSTTVSDHNGVDSSNVKYGGQTLLDLSDGDCRITYDKESAFSVESGYEFYPVTNLSWGGAVMFCNWLTEMRDGNTDNVVYYGWNESEFQHENWDYNGTGSDLTKNGYRLPTSPEWEYSARYLGTNSPASGSPNLNTEYIARNTNGGNSSLATGYYWTPGDYASGAINDCNNSSDTGNVAAYSGNSSSAQVSGSKDCNVLDLHDMSGNLSEWLNNQGKYRGGS